MTCPFHKVHCKSRSFDQKKLKTKLTTKCVWVELKMDIWTEMWHFKQWWSVVQSAGQSWWRIWSKRSQSYKEEWWQPSRIEHHQPPVGTEGSPHPRRQCFPSAPMRQGEKSMEPYGPMSAQRFPNATKSGSRLTNSQFQAAWVIFVQKWWLHNCLARPKVQSLALNTLYFLSVRGPLKSETCTPGWT